MRRCIAFFISLLLVAPVAACGGPVPPAGRLSGIDAGLAARAAQAAAGELKSLVEGPVTPADSGLSRAEFARADRDGDGRLSADEQLGAFQQLWGQVLAVAEAKGKGAASPAPSASPPPYAVPHPLTLAPARAEVYVDAAEVLPAVKETIRAARHSVWLDLFLLGGDEGMAVAELLVAKMREGVDVRLIHDPGLGLGGVAQTQVLRAVKFLIGEAVPIRYYPIRQLKQRRGHPLANKFLIDHNKFLIVDGHTALIGTMNLIDIGTMNHDVYIRIDGEPARELAAIHRATWAHSDPAAVETPPPAPQVSPIVTAPAGLARVTKTDIDRRSTKQVLLENIKGARKSIHIAIFEFGDMDVAKALVDAAKRGLDVKVLADDHRYFAKYVPALRFVEVYGLPNLLPMNALREAGVPVKWYVSQIPGRELHMKVAVFDGERALAGSTNYTYQSFENFRETSVDIVGGEVPGRLEAMFAQDWETAARPVTKPNFRERCFMVATKYMDKFNLSWW